MNKNGKADPAPASVRRKRPGVGPTGQKRGEDIEPRLPHDRDESADSQDTQAPGVGQASAERIGEQAFEDLRAGRQDTGRAPVTDEVYENLRKPVANGSRKRGS